MKPDISKTSTGPTAGPEDEYINHVPVILEEEAVRPGSTKVKNLCIKLITVIQ